MIYHVENGLVCLKCRTALIFHSISFSLRVEFVNFLNWNNFQVQFYSL